MADEMDEAGPPQADKRDYAIVKYMYQHVPMRIGNLHGMEVKCFYGEDAVNCLLDSPWATGKEAIFSDRESCVDFCLDLMIKEMLHRAKLAKRKSKPGDSHGGNCCGGHGSAAEEPKKSKKKLKSKEETEDDKEKESSAAGEDKSKDEKKKVKKLKLEMCEEQYFADGKEVFVWVYEPVSWRNTIIGLLILVGLIAICCYPLWPEMLRTAVYYASLSGVGLLGGILFLAIFRYIVYGIVITLTLGEHKFFLFPNLTEDCGFFESFVPAFEYSRTSQEAVKKNKKAVTADDQKDDKIIETKDEDADGNNDESNGYEVIDPKDES